MVVGISEYPQNEAFDLRYPETDAREIYEVLSTSPGADTSDLTLLTNAAASRSSVLAALDTAIQSLPQDSLLVVYYSGHGILDPGEQPQWILSAPSLDDPESTLAFAEVKALLQRSRSRSKLLLSDAAFSGSAIGSTR